MKRIVMEYNIKRSNVESDFMTIEAGIYGELNMIARLSDEFSIFSLLGLLYYRSDRQKPIHPCPVLY